MAPIASASSVPPHIHPPIAHAPSAMRETLSGAAIYSISALFGLISELMIPVLLLVLFAGSQARSRSRSTGRARIRLPVAAKMALQSAAATGGTPGSIGVDVDRPSIDPKSHGVISFEHPTISGYRWETDVRQTSESRGAPCVGAS